MTNLNAKETIDYIVNFLRENDSLKSEMEIYQNNLLLLSDVRKMVVTNPDQNIIDTINQDLTHIKLFIVSERVMTDYVENLFGDYDDLTVDNEEMYNQRVDSIELVRLGVIYFLMLSVDLNKVIETERNSVILAVNAMRNRPYEKFDVLMKTLLHKNLVSRLNQYIADNNGDRSNKARIISLKLSQYINKNEISFANEAELDQFIDDYIKNEVNPRIGEPISFH